MLLRPASTAALLHARRDPALAGRMSGALAALILLWPLFEATKAHPGALFDPANVQLVGHFLAGFLPPASDAGFLRLLGKATLETLAMATAGLLLALFLALPLAWWMTRAAREHQGITLLPRALVTLLRGIPELVWALLFVRVFGLGPAAGVLALGLTYGGMLAKVYAEILESVDPAPARALRLAGAGRLAAVLYGLIPQAIGEIGSYTVYRWECALRASVVMGLVGAGGLGQLLDQAMKLLNGGEVASVLLAFLALVFFADLLASPLRDLGSKPLKARRGGLGWRDYGVLALLLLAFVASFAYLDIDPKPLFDPASLASMAEFLAAFMAPDLAPSWLHGVALAAWETLALSVVGTLLAGLLGLLLALGRPRSLFRLLANVLRAVPELVWATLTVLAVGIGPFAGALALMLHTAGVFGRLYGSSLEQATAAATLALRQQGAPAPLAFLYGTLPVAAPQLLAYTLYRWEINIRMAAVLGFVGAGGLGQLLYVQLSLFNHAQAASVMAVMLLLSLLVDYSSARLRRYWS